MTEPRQSLRRRRNIAIAAATITLAAGISWWLVGDDDIPAAFAMSTDLAALGWRPNDRCAYDLIVESGITMHPDSVASQVTETRLRALLCARVLAAGAGTARVAMQLRGIQRESAGARDERHEAALGRPFVVEFLGGMPSKFEFPPALDTAVRSELAELVRTFQVTLPPPATTKWSALEEHETGRYRAAYEVLAGGSWHKRKAAYLPTGAPGEEPDMAQIRIFESSAMLTPAASSSWWERAEVNDDQQLSVSASPFVRVKMRSVLQVRPNGFDATSDIDLPGEADALLRVASPALDDQGAAAVPRDAGPEDRAQFLALVAVFVGSGGKDFNAMHSLAALLKQFPELAAELLPLLADASLAGGASAGLVHAMELAGNEACQDALGAVCSKATYPMDNRKRAIIGLGGVEKPSEATVAAIWGLSSQLDPDGGNDLAHTSLLALGSMGHHLQDTDATRSAELSFGLQATLTAAAPEARAVVLKAIYNTHDATLLPVAQAELDSPAPMVRAAAAMAVSAMDRTEAFDSLFSRVKIERDSWVRASLIDGMGKLSHKSDAAFAECADMVRSERDPQVRMSLARYLVENLDHYPAGRTTLQAIMNDQSASSQLRSYLVKNLFRSKSSSRRTGPGR